MAWLDEREVAAPLASGSDGHAEHAAEPDASIYLATSPDFGGSWGPNRRAWKAACPCCRVSLARGGDGRAIAAWRQHFPGNVRDVVTAVADDRSSEPKRVHPDDWTYAGCPHTGPAIATGTDGTVHVAWYTGKEGGLGVYYARQTPGGDPGSAVALVTGAGLGVAHPAVVALPDGGRLPPTTRRLTAGGSSALPASCSGAGLPDGSWCPAPRMAGTLNSPFSTIASR